MFLSLQFNAVFGFFKVMEVFSLSVSSWVSFGNLCQGIGCFIQVVRFILIRLFVILHDCVVGSVLTIPVSDLMLIIYVFSHLVLIFTELDFGFIGFCIFSLVCFLFHWFLLVYFLEGGRGRGVGGRDSWAPRPVWSWMWGLISRPRGHDLSPNQASDA